MISPDFDRASIANIHMIHGKLHIGWARGEITPPRKTLLLGQFYARLAEGTDSPLTATALAIEARDEAGATEQAVFLSCDLAADAFKSDLIRALQGRCPGLDLQKLTVNATHTHDAPCLVPGFYEEPADDPDYMTPDAYRLWLAARLADIVTEAWSARRPGSIARGFGYAVVGRCRRAVYADGSSLMYGATDREDFRGFEACDDHAVNLLFTRDAAGALTGMVVNLACPSQCREHLLTYSADYWHVVRAGLAERYGAGVHLLPQCAPAGDLSPHLLIDEKAEADLRVRMGLDGRRLLARRILAAIDEGLACASTPESAVAFAHDVQTLRLPRLKVTREEYELEKRLPSMNAEERAQQTYAFRQIWPFGPVCELISRYEQQGDDPRHDIESHVIRLGDVAFATNPFELFVDYGLRIRARSRALQTFLVQLADGSGHGGYLPTQRALDGGHYSAMIKSNWVGPEGGQQLVEATVGAIAALFEGTCYPGLENNP